jgi:hypothetical protein
VGEKKEQNQKQKQNETVIRNEDLIKFRKLIEAFADVDNRDYDYSDIYLETNRNIKNICKSLVDKPTANDEQEAELCYVLLLAISTIAIVSNSPLIDKVIRRSERILNHIKSSLRKAQLCTYLYCLESNEEYKNDAYQIIDSWKDKKMTEEEKRLVRNFKLITEL